MLIPSFITHRTEDVLLSPREAECLFLKSQGRSSKESAQQLGLSHRTVEKNLENMRVKLAGVSEGAVKDFMLSLKCFSLGSVEC